MIISVDELKVNGEKEIRISLNEGVTLIDFVVIRYPLHKRIWFGIKRFFTWRK